MTYDMRIRVDSGEYMSGQKGYFSLNNSGMSKYLQIMWRLWMLHNSNSPVGEGEWPTWNETLPEEEAEKDWLLRLEKVTIRHGDTEEPTIPMHKFSSNDHWIVSPDEIKASLKNYEKEDKKDVEYLIDRYGLNPREGWYKWIDFLKLAAEHEGFMVS